MRRIITAVQILLWAAVCFSQKNPTYEPVNMGYFEGVYRLVYGPQKAGSIEYCDFNEDGVIDLSISDPYHVFMNYGTNENPQYQLYPIHTPYEPAHDGNLACSYYDINNDGELDLLRDYTGFYYGGSFYDRSFSSKLYLNEGTTSNPNWGNWSNIITIEAGDWIPQTSSQFVNLNGDSLMDIICRNNIYINQGSPENPIFEKDTSIYISDDYWTSCVVAADIDDDGDYDLLYGINDRIHLLENTGTTYLPEFQLIDSCFCGIQHADISELSMYDIDFDEDLDLFIVADLKEIKYENIGTPEQAVFELSTERLISPFPDELYEKLGSNPYPYFGVYRPRFADLDFDGDQDLITAVIENDYDDGGYLQMWENRLDNGEPDWYFKYDSIFVDPDLEFNNFTFIDLDGDGFDDLILDVYVNNISKSRYYRNTGNMQEPEFCLARSDILSGYSRVKHGGFADINSDGEYEYLVGEYGYIALYENEGSLVSPDFVLTNSQYLDFYYDIWVGDVSLECADYDNDMDIDIFISEHEWNDPWAATSEYYHTYYYRNDGTAENPDYILSDLNNEYEMDLYNMVSVDIDNDGKLDLFKGWTYYQCTSVPRYRPDDPIEYEPYPEEPDPQIPLTTALKPVFPNPFNQIATIPVDLSEDAAITLTVYDLLGRQVAVILDQTCIAGSHCFHWNASAQNSGIYFIKLESTGKSQIRKAVLVK